MPKKIILTHEHEEKIAWYCARNQLKFDLANAFDITMETFKNDPIMQQQIDETGNIKEENITPEVARSIEFHPKTIERIAAKSVGKAEQFLRANYINEIKKSKLDEKPDLDCLVDNLYKLNIVDLNSYLSLICFLMQLKYTRDGELTENDKTCVFFNGVARNGKSATAAAICEVESKYGNVFKAHSAKLLESTHEEQLWKSHLNYFDEAKPSDIPRELLFTLVNGGNVEINPKNKEPYNYSVHTNCIFTSNDQINMKQRRVSVIKFGNRLNGRPLEQGTLKKIITDIMNSLPSFEHYYSIYHIVSKENESRLNPLAIEGIITYLEEFLNFSTPENERSLTAEKIFNAHDIYTNIKDKYQKQVVPAERKESIRIALKALSKSGYLTEIKYPTCSTKFYKIFGSDFLKLKEEFGKANTCDEKNEKISKPNLILALSPYFQNPPLIPSFDDDKQEDKETEEAESSYHEIMAGLNAINPKDETSIQVSCSMLKQAYRCFELFKKANTKLIQETKLNPIDINLQQLAYLAKTTMTSELCECVHYDVIINYYKDEFGPCFQNLWGQYIFKVYCDLTKCHDSNLVRLRAETKAKNIPHFSELSGVKMASAYGFHKGSALPYIQYEKKRDYEESLRVDKELSDWISWYQLVNNVKQEKQMRNEAEPFFPSFEYLENEIPF